MVRTSFLRPVLANIALDRKASIARRQGLKPANSPAAKTVIMEDIVKSPSLAMVMGGLSLADTTAKIMRTANINKIDLV